MDTDTFQTRDLHESAFLFSHKVKLIKLVKEENFFWFVFLDKDKAEALLAKYWARDAKVDALTYSEALRSLKDMLFARKNRF